MRTTSRHRIAWLGRDYVELPLDAYLTLDPRGGVYALTYPERLETFSYVGLSANVRQRLATHAAAGLDTPLAEHAVRVGVPVDEVRAYVRSSVWAYVIYEDDAFERQRLEYRAWFELGGVSMLNRTVPIYPQDVH